MKQDSSVARPYAQLRPWPSSAHAKCSIQRRIDNATRPDRIERLQARLERVESREALLLSRGGVARATGGASGGQGPGARDQGHSSSSGEVTSCSGSADELEAQKRDLRQQAAALESAATALQAQQTALQAEAAQLQRQADALKRQKHQAERQKAKAQQLQKKLTRELTRAGGDKRATDPRIVHLQKDLLATSGVVALTPPQVSDTGDALVLNAIPTTAPASDATASLVEEVRSSVLPPLADVGLRSHVGGYTASYVDLATKILRSCRSSSRPS